MTDALDDCLGVGIVNGDDLDGRIIRGRETAATLTSLALAILWDDPERNNFDCPWNWREQYE